MKILMLNGSPRPNGNTALALKEMEGVFAAEGMETALIQVGNRDIRSCVACGRCGELGRCVFDDLVNEIAPKFQACDGLVVGILCLCQRHSGGSPHPAFYSTPFDKTMKVGASVLAARRGGLTAAFDELNKFFTISGMPVASSQYWNGVHGALPGEAAQDAEGLQTMRTLARNMAFLVKSIALGRGKYGLPAQEPFARTNFIR